MPGQIARRPYLQLVTPSSIVVRWDTQTSKVDTVWYGATETSLTEFKSDIAATAKHEITINGLAPKHKYYYSVTGPSGGSLDQYFVTAPVPGTAQLTRFWVISDFGQSFTAECDARRLVTINIWKAFNNNSLAADFILSLGDQTESGSDSQLQANFFNQLQDVLRVTPLFTVVGNHEDSDHRVVYKASFALPANAEAGGIASGTEDYYSFTYGNIHIVVLSAEGVDMSGAETRWLQNDLAGNKSDWLVAVMHRPMHSAGSNKTDADPIALSEKTNWLPLLEAAGVDLILAGHYHVYERSYMVDNLTGTSASITPANKIDTTLGRIDMGGAYHKEPGQPHEGTIFVNCAAGGYSSGANNLIRPFSFMPVVYRGSNYEGSLVVDVDGGKRMDVSFLCDELDSLGSHVWDHFTILKEPEGVSDDRDQNLLPKDFTISNYPNPFNPNTTIRYSVPSGRDLVRGADGQIPNPKSQIQGE